MGEFPLPALTGLAASSNISYPGPTSGNSGQTFFITDATTNFASLPTISGRTSQLFVTITASDGATVVWGSGTAFLATFIGTMFTPGTQYAVAFTTNGTILSTPIIATASTPSNPSDPGGEIDVATPFSNLTLPPDGIVGIVVGR
jgi:hypothetical protein